MSKRKLTVLVPEDGIEVYNMYAAGIPEKITDLESHHEIVFDFNSVVVLYYYYPGRRRVYVVCNPRRINYMNVVQLPGVSDPVSVLYCFTGRNFDSLKNALFYIEKISNLRVYNQSINFWIRLILIIISKRNRNRYLDVLYRRESKKTRSELCLI